MMNFSDTEDTRQEATKKIHNRELGYIWGSYTADWKKIKKKNSLQPWVVFFGRNLLLKGSQFRKRHFVTTYYAVVEANVNRACSHARSTAAAYCCLLSSLLFTSGRLKASLSMSISFSTISSVGCISSRTLFTVSLIDDVNFLTKAPLIGSSSPCRGSSSSRSCLIAIPAICFFRFSFSSTMLASLGKTNAVKETYLFLIIIQLTCARLLVTENERID